MACVISAATRKNLAFVGHNSRMKILFLNTNMLQTRIPQQSATHISAMSLFQEMAMKQRLSCKQQVQHLIKAQQWAVLVVSSVSSIHQISQQTTGWSTDSSFMVMSLVEHSKTAQTESTLKEAPTQAEATLLAQ